MSRPLFLLLASAVLTACAGASSEQPTGAELRQGCPEPRPQVCTLEYAPVCAFVGKQGTRKEFASGCSACGDASVSAYIPGPCPGE
jgi:hypothetical protein